MRMVVGEEKVVKVKLLQDMVVRGEVKSVGDVVEVSPGDAGRFGHMGRVVIVSAVEEAKFPAVGSVAAPVVETVAVEVENFPVNDQQQVPVDVASEFPEGSSRNAEWDSSFAGEGDPYGISEYTSQSFAGEELTPGQKAARTRAANAAAAKAAGGQ